MNLNQQQTNLLGMVMVGLHDQRTLKCCLTQKTFAFIYRNSIHANKRRANQICIGKEITQRIKTNRNTSTFSFLDIYSYSRIDRKPTSRRLLLLHFLSIVKEKFPSSTLILSKPGFLIHFLSRLQQRSLQFGGTPLLVY